MWNFLPRITDRRTTGWLVGVSTLLLMFAVSCGEAEKAAEPGEVTGVATAEAQSAKIPDIQTAVGVVRAKNRSTIAAKVMGNVVAVHVNEGDPVHQGQLLLEIDSRDMDAQLRKAEAGLQEVEQGIIGARSGVDAAEANKDLATATYERFKALRDRNSVSAQEFDEVEARWKAAVAQWKSAGQMLAGLQAKKNQVLADVATARAAASWARITSPIDGVVTARNVDVGDQAAPGMPLMTVDGRGAWRVETSLEESRLGLARPGEAVRVHVDALDADLTGRVVHVAPALDSATRSYLVKIDLPDDGRLQSGMFARVGFRSGDRSAVTVPSAAIVRNGQLEGVWIIDAEGQARYRLIKSGDPVGSSTEVLSGLDGGEQVIVDGIANLTDGAHVATSAPKGSQS